MGPCPRIPSGPAVMYDRNNRPDTRLHPTTTPKHQINPCNAGAIHTGPSAKARMGATHFLMKTLPRVASEMALHVLAYNLTRVLNIMGVRPLTAAIRA